MHDRNLDRRVSDYFDHLRNQPTPPHVNSLVMEDVVNATGRIKRTLGALALTLAVGAGTAAAVTASRHQNPAAGSAVSPTAATVDVSGARAAAAGYFDPAVPPCWTERIRTSSEGSRAYPDDFSGCPVTPRLGHRLKAMAGLVRTNFREDPPPAGMPQPAPSPGVEPDVVNLRVGPAVATSRGAIVTIDIAIEQSNVGGSRVTDRYREDAVVVMTPAGWRLDDILIHGSNVPDLPGRPFSGGFVPEADGKLVISIYSACLEAHPGASGVC